MRSWTSTKRRRRAVLIALACVTASLAASGCGEDDFPNDPRPPTTVELTALINDSEVVVSPKPDGAGPVTITISNQSGEPAKLLLIKGSGSGKPISSQEITPNGGTGKIQANLEEGTYTASVDNSVGIQTDTIDVGPERKSAQNKLLLP